jgi:hypothetical protein
VIQTRGLCVSAPGALIAVLLLPDAARAEALPPDSPLWEIRATEGRVVEHLGRKALVLKGGDAIVKDSRFTDGVIEFDLAFTGERGFMGAMWRMWDESNYENFYIRPHQSGNPDANQYQPVFNGAAAWQLYHGEGYGAPVRYTPNQWTHVKIVVAGERAEIYVGDAGTPALFVSDLKHETRPGRVGLSVGPFAPGYFSNFTYTATDAVTLVGKPRAPEATPPGTVTSWRVSGAFAGRSLEGKDRLDPADKEPLGWTRLASEATGITNLARVQGPAENRDTAFARLVIRSEREQVKRFRFGFSDAVRVYLNDRLLYAGSDRYQSRDYRFLGTMGLFDELYLPLSAGRNELWLAVTEAVGGWGVKGAFHDMEGIRLEDE